MSEEPADEKNGDETPEDAPEDAPENGENGGEEFDGDEGDEPPKGGGRKKLIAIVAAVVVLLSGGGGGAYYFGLLDSLLGLEKGSKIAILDLGAPVRYELPMIKADLKTNKCRSALVRTVIVVELGSKDLKRLEAMQLRIMDGISTYFRDLERQDLVGRKGSDKFRYDATRIINNMIAPARIQTLIFKEFIVQ
jgi:flagellar FliL protein